MAGRNPGFPEGDPTFGSRDPANIQPQGSGPAVPLSVRRAAERRPAPEGPGQAPGGGTPSWAPPGSGPPPAHAPRPQPPGAWGGSGPVPGYVGGMSMWSTGSMGDAPGASSGSQGPPRWNPSSAPPESTGMVMIGGSGGGSSAPSMVLRRKQPQDLDATLNKLKGMALPPQEAGPSLTFTRPGPAPPKPTSPWGGAPGQEGGLEGGREGEGWAVGGGDGSGEAAGWGAASWGIGTSAPGFGGGAVIPPPPSVAPVPPAAVPPARVRVPQVLSSPAAPPPALATMDVRTVFDAAPLPSEVWMPAAPQEDVRYLMPGGGRGEGGFLSSLMSKLRATQPLLLVVAVVALLMLVVGGAFVFGWHHATSGHPHYGGVDLPMHMLVRNDDLDNHRLDGWARDSGPVLSKRYSSLRDVDSDSDSDGRDYGSNHGANQGPDHGSDHGANQGPNLGSDHGSDESSDSSDGDGGDVGGGGSDEDTQGQPSPQGGREEEPETVPADPDARRRVWTTMLRGDDDEEAAPEVTKHPRLISMIHAIQQANPAANDSDTGEPAHDDSGLCTTLETCHGMRPHMTPAQFQSSAGFHLTEPCMEMFISRDVHVRCGTPCQVYTREDMIRARLAADASGNAHVAAGNGDAVGGDTDGEEGPSFLVNDEMHFIYVMVRQAGSVFVGHWLKEQFPSSRRMTLAELSAPAPAPVHATSKAAVTDLWAHGGAGMGMRRDASSARESAQEVVHRELYFRFAVVRNPITRAVAGEYRRLVGEGPDATATQDAPTTTVAQRVLARLESSFEGRLPAPAPLRSQMATLLQPVQNVSGFAYDAVYHLERPDLFRNIYNDVTEAYEASRGLHWQSLTRAREVPGSTSPRRGANNAVPRTYRDFEPPVGIAVELTPPSDEEVAVTQALLSNRATMAHICRYLLQDLACFRYGWPFDVCGWAGVTIPDYSNPQAAPANIPPRVAPHSPVATEDASDSSKHVILLGSGTAPPPPRLTSFSVMKNAAAAAAAAVAAKSSGASDSEQRPAPGPSVVAVGDGQAPMRLDPSAYGADVKTSVAGLRTSQPQPGGPADDGDVEARGAARSARGASGGSVSVPERHKGHGAAIQWDHDDMAVVGNAPATERIDKVPRRPTVKADKGTSRSSQRSKAAKDLQVNFDDPDVIVVGGASRPLDKKAGPQSKVAKKAGPQSKVATIIRDWHNRENTKKEENKLEHVYKALHKTGDTSDDEGKKGKGKGSKGDEAVTRAPGATRADRRWLNAFQKVAGNRGSEGPKWQ